MTSVNYYDYHYHYLHENGYVSGSVGLSVYQDISGLIALEEIYIPFVIVVVAGLVVIIIIIIFTIIIIVVNLPWLQAGHPAGFRAACSSDVTLMYRTSSDSAAFFLPVYFLIKINPCFYII